MPLQRHLSSQYIHPASGAVGLACWLKPARPTSIRSFAVHPPPPVRSHSTGVDNVNDQTVQSPQERRRINHNGISKPQGHYFYWSRLDLHGLDPAPGQLKVEDERASSPQDLQAPLILDPRTHSRKRRMMETLEKKEQAEGEQAEGQQAEGQQAEGQQAEGEQAEGEQAEGGKAKGKQAEGKQAEGKQAEGKQAEGKQAEGKQAEGKQAEGKQFEWTQQHWEENKKFQIVTTIGIAKEGSLVDPSKAYLSYSWSDCLREVKELQGPLSLEDLFLRLDSEPVMEREASDYMTIYGSHALLQIATRLINIFDKLRKNRRTHTELFMQPSGDTGESDEVPKASLVRKVIRGLLDFTGHVGLMRLMAKRSIGEGGAMTVHQKSAVDLLKKLDKGGGIHGYCRDLSRQIAIGNAPKRETLDLCDLLDKIDWQEGSLNLNLGKLMMLCTAISQRCGPMASVKSSHPQRYAVGDNGTGQMQDDAQQYPKKRERTETLERVTEQEALLETALPNSASESTKTSPELFSSATPTEQEALLETRLPNSASESTKISAGFVSSQASATPKGRDPKALLVDELFPASRSAKERAASRTRPTFPVPQIRTTLSEEEKPLVRLLAVESKRDKWESSMEGETAVLRVRASSPNMSMEDFIRMSPPGKHIQDWKEGDLEKVIPIRDERTFQIMGTYWLLFKSIASARAYATHVMHLHKLSKKYTPTSLYSPLPLAPGAEDPLDENENQEQLLLSYAFLPKTQPVHNELLMPPYRREVRSILKRGGYRSIIYGNNEAENTVIHKVLLSFDGMYQPSLQQIEEVFYRSRRHRGLEWGILDDGQWIWNFDELNDLHGEPSTEHFKRWVVGFESEGHAKTFVRTWHRRSWLWWKDQSELREEDGEPPVVNATFLW